MNKLLAALLALVLPSTAFAGVGATAHLSSLNDGTTMAPTLDYRAKGFLIQVDVLTLLGSVGGDNDDHVLSAMGIEHDALNLGLVGSYVVMKKKCMPDIEGVWMPGLDIRYKGYIGDTGKGFSDAELQAGGFHAVLESRLGMEMKNGAGFGVYVVPKFGLSTIRSIGAKDSTITATYGGGIEVSAWFNK